jgi:hypothetical protein
MSDVGRRIRELRMAAGWSVLDLADIADLDRGRVAGFEDGDVIPLQGECQLLELVLPGCSPQELGMLQYGDTYRGVPGFDARVSET